MKRFLLSLLALFTLFAVFTPASAMTATQSNGLYYKMQFESAVCNAAKDTLVAVDSVTLLTNFIPAQKGELALCFNSFTGTGADSVVAVARVTAMNSAGTVIGYAISDTIKSGTGGQVVLPIGTAALGYKFTVKLMTLTGTGGQLIVNFMELWRRQGVSTQLLIGR